MRVTATADGCQNQPVSRTSRVTRLGQSGHVRRRHRDTLWGRARVEASLPEGVHRARSQQGWLADVANTPDFARMRSDAQEHVLAVARVVALCADWTTYTSRPTWDALQERTGLSRRTVARHLAWLREHHLLAWVERGTTADLSPGILQTGPHGTRPGNIASVYLLTAPAHLRLVAVSRPEDLGVEHVHTGPVDAVEAAAWPAPEQDQDHAGAPQEVQDEPPPLEAVDRTGTPSGFGFALKSPARARKADLSGPGLRPGQKTPHPMRQVPPDTASEEPPWDLSVTPAGKQERLAAAAILQRHLPVLGRISTAHVASLLREWHLAGWTPRDVLTALGTRPDGTPWRHSHDIRHVPGWIRHRLAPWRTNPTDPTSPVGLSPTTRAAGEAARTRALTRAAAEQATAAETAARAAAAGPATVTQLAAAARAQLRTRHDTPATVATAVTTEAATPAVTPVSATATPATSSRAATTDWRTTATVAGPVDGSSSVDRAADGSAMADTVVTAMAATTVGGDAVATADMAAAVAADIQRTTAAHIAALRAIVRRR